MDTLANLGEILGGLGVLISLIFLAIQIRKGSDSNGGFTTASSTCVAGKSILYV